MTCVVPKGRYKVACGRPRERLWEAGLDSPGAYLSGASSGFSVLLEMHFGYDVVFSLSFNSHQANQFMPLIHVHSSMTVFMQ